MASEPLTPELICRDLATRLVGRTVYCLDEIDSTNRLARQYAEAGVPDGTVLTAEYQTAGRGRLGRTWTAPPNSSLLCSIIFYPDLAPDRLFRLTMLASIAVTDTLHELAGIKAGIKWPNDIYVNEKKISGILSEVDCRDDRVRYAVVGIGLNVNWTPAGTDLENQAISLQQCTGRETSRLSVLKLLLHKLDDLYQRLHCADLPELWKSRCVHMGKKIQVHSEDSVLQGVAAGITDTGHLIVITPDGTKEMVCGDVSLRW